MSTSDLSFELYVFDESKEEVAPLIRPLPSIWRALFVAGVPKSFIGRRYTVNAGLSLLMSKNDEPLVRFGSTGLVGSICVDIATGKVVEVINAGVPSSPMLFVNTSLTQFTQTVKAIIDRFPYYGQEATDDEIDLVASELLDVVRNIDPEAAVPDRYWSTFVDDVQIGDLSTEAVLAIGE